LVICLCSSGLLSAVLVTLGALYFDVIDDDEDRTEDNDGRESGDSTESSVSKAWPSFCAKQGI